MKYRDLPNAPVDYERPTPLRDDLLAPFGNAVGCLLLLVGFPAWIGVCHWWPA